MNSQDTTIDEPHTANPSGREAACNCQNTHRINEDSYPLRSHDWNHKIDNGNNTSSNEGIDKGKTNVGKTNRRKSKSHNNYEVDDDESSTNENDDGDRKNQHIQQDDTNHSLHKSHTVNCSSDDNRGE